MKERLVFYASCIRYLGTNQHFYETLSVPYDSEYILSKLFSRMKEKDKFLRKPAVTLSRSTIFHRSSRVLSR